MEPAQQGVVNEDGVYKKTSLGKAAGRQSDGTYRIKPIPKVHIDPGDAVFLAKGSMPIGRRKGGPLLDELAASKEVLRIEEELEAERRRIEEEEERIRREAEAEQFVKDLEQNGLQAVEDSKNPNQKKRRKKKNSNEAAIGAGANGTLEPSADAGIDPVHPSPQDHLGARIESLGRKKQLPQSPVRADLSQWFQQLEKLQTDLSEVESVQVRPLEEKLQKISHELEHSQQLAKQYKSRAHSLEKDLKRINNTHEELKVKHKHLKESTDWDIKGLTFKVEELQQIVDKGTKKLEAKVETLQAALNEQSGLLVLEKKNVRTVEKKMKKIQEQVSLANELKVKAEERCQKLGKETKLLKAKLSGIQSKVQELEQVKELVTKQAAAQEKTENERKRLKLEIENLEKTNVALQKKSVEEREILEFQVAELKVQVAKGTATEVRGSKKFEKQIRQLKSLVKQTETSKTETENRLSEKLTKTKEEFQKILTKTKGKLKEVEEENRAVKSANQKCEQARSEESNLMSQQLMTLDAAHIALSKKHQNMCITFEKEIKVLKSEIIVVQNTKDIENTHLKKNISQLEARLNQAKSHHMAREEKDEDEIGRLDSWNKELEQRLVLLEKQHKAALSEIEVKLRVSEEAYKQTQGSHETEITLLQKRLALAIEQAENTRASREEEKVNMIAEFEEVEKGCREALNDLTDENTKLRDHISKLNKRFIETEKAFDNEKQLLRRQIGILEADKKDAYTFKYMDDEDSKLMEAVVQLAEAQSKCKSALVESNAMEQKIRSMNDQFDRERADFQLEARLALKKQIEHGEQMAALKEEAYGMHRKLHEQGEQLLEKQKQIDEKTHLAGCLQSKYDIMVERMNAALKEDERQILMLHEQIKIFSNDSYRLIL